MDIDFDDFVQEFYSNETGIKMAFQLSIEDDNDTTVFDIHEMLLELFIKGLYMKNLSISYNKALGESINKLQKYFNNIQVKIIIQTYTIGELLSDSSEYNNRYLRIMPGSDFVKNGQLDENLIDEISDIKSFFMIDNNLNIKISFDHLI